VTIAVATGDLGLIPQPSGPPRSRRSKLKRILLVTGSALVALILVVASFVGFSLYRIDHAVHHVEVSPSLLARGKNDLLAIVKGPDHSEQVFVFHNVAGHTNVLQIPQKLGLPLANGSSVPLGTLSLHAPTTIIAGLARLGIPVSHYVGVDLHKVDPASSLGQLATGKLSMASMMSNPTGTSSILEQVASHIYLGPGTPVSAVLSLMNVPTAHPVSVPTERDVHGTIVLAAAFANVLRAFL
jgi:hypothetical protein